MEIFTLGLQSDNDCVRFGRDLAIAHVQANGSNTGDINTLAVNITLISFQLKLLIIETVSISEVEVSIMSSDHQEINESSGFFEICLEANHQSQSVFEITLSTMDGTAIGT